METKKAIGIGIGLFALYGIFHKKKSDGFQLSKFYTVEDLTNSDTARDLGISEQFSTPPNDILNNAKYYADKLLDPITTKLGRPMYVESWYRSPALNEAVGGVDDSLHMKALAADLKYKKFGHNAAKDIVKAVISEALPFHKMILTGPENDPTTIHISLKRSGNAYQPYYKGADGSYTKVPIDVLYSRLNV